MYDAPYASSAHTSILSETLSAELSFSSKRLLRYQRVRAGRTCMDLVVYQMMQFQVVHVSDVTGLSKNSPVLPSRRPHLTVS